MTPRVPQTIDLLRQAQGLGVCYLGIVRGLFEAVPAEGASIASLAARAGCEPRYVTRWVAAAQEAGLLSVGKEGAVHLTESGARFSDPHDNPDAARVLQAVYSVLICDTMAPFFLDGERPGYQVVNRFAVLSPWYGSIFESLYRPVWATEVQPGLAEIFDRVNALEHQGRFADFGAGDGWLVRAIASQYEHISCTAVTQASPGSLPSVDRVAYADQAAFFGAADRYDAILVNKVAHHLGAELDTTIARLAEKLREGGHLIIWDFAWPVAGAAADGDDRGFLNLVEHVQQSGFVPQDELEQALEDAGLDVSSFKVRDGHEVVLVAAKNSQVPTRPRDRSQ